MDGQTNRQTDRQVDNKQTKATYEMTILSGSGLEGIVLRAQKAIGSQWSQGTYSEEAEK